MSRLWDAFVDLNATRGGGFGPGPISYAEIEAWSRVTRHPVSAWDVAVIRRCDETALLAWQPKRKPRPGEPRLIDARDASGVRSIFTGRTRKVKRPSQPG